MKFSRYLRDGRLQIKATKSFPLQDAGKAHEWVESRKSTGKVILTVSPLPEMNTGNRGGIHWITNYACYYR